MEKGLKFPKVEKNMREILERMKRDVMEKMEKVYFIMMTIQF